MRLKDYLTDDTEFISAYKKNPSIAYYPGRQKIYYKSFDINEFICERIATIKNLNVNHYFLLSLDDFHGRVKYRNIKSNNSDLKIGSYDFCTDKSKLYIPCSTGVDLYDVLEWPNNDKNREELADEILKLFALDIYTWQRDRCFYNIMFELDDNRDFHLGKIYDFEESFDVIDSYDGIFHYDNSLYKFRGLEDYLKLMDEFPKFREYLKSYQDINLCREIEHVFEEKSLDISKFPMEQYKMFEDKSQKMLCKILR